MKLVTHDFPAHLSREAELAASPNDDAPTLIAFRNPQQLNLLIRATAFVFSDPQSRALQTLIERIAPSEATALIIGETGTGKELVARHIHALSKRRDAQFVAINCGAFSETLIESELFGYERGAFTGAQQGKAGWFEAAHGGTLFLDEIGDLPLTMQVKLLRVLQEREVVRLGSRRPVPIDVRLVAATNIDLAEAVRAGRFREDLYYRLQVMTLPLKPLRERAGDILPLAQHFLSMYAKRLHLSKAKLAPDAAQAIVAYPWPGNIRELENVIHRALLVCHDGLVTPADLHLPAWRDADTAAGIDSGSRPMPKRTASQEAPSPVESPAFAALRTAWQALLQSDEEIRFEDILHRFVVEAWWSNERNQVRAARQLNISRNVLRTYLKKAGAL